jgi:hypothetical protein
MDDGVVQWLYHQRFQVGVPHHRRKPLTLKRSKSSKTSRTEDNVE